ncbi:MAG: LytR C-terminal domain-containing protein [Elusimicrobiaceae bacterium]|nr:LytR C-terminal domain-containing protein [Elusimicrobiaceae bacterium]
MESPHKTRKIIERGLIILALLLLGWAGFARYTSGLVKTLSLRQEQDVLVTVGTSPAMEFTYNPAFQKVRVTVQDKKCKGPVQKCFPQGKFFIPRQSSYPLFWEDFKHTLSSWRYNPLLALRTGWSYLTAYHERRTNHTPAEFWLHSLELAQLQTNDFTLKEPIKNQKNKRRTAEPDGPPAPVADKAPLAVQDRPIIAEVLNASGRKGLALELTQYLREQNTKGLLRVDVLQYDNYPTLQETSWLEDYSGRQIQLKQLGNAIGINGEIRAGTTPNVICDTRIILGKDFKMPL